MSDVRIVTNKAIYYRAYVIREDDSSISLRYTGRDKRDRPVVRIDRVQKRDVIEKKCFKE